MAIRTIQPERSLCRIDAHYDSLIYPQRTYQFAKVMCTGNYFFNANSIGAMKRRPSWWKKPIVLTLNGNFKFNQPHDSWIDFIQMCRIRLVLGAKEEIRFQTTKAFEWSLKNNLPIVWTAQRWKGINDTKPYLKNDPSCSSHMTLLGYKSSAGGWYKPQMDLIRKLVDTQFDSGVICDEKEKGCTECGICASNYKKWNGSGPSELIILNTGTMCPRGCPSCFVRRGRTSGHARVGVFITNSKIRGKISQPPSLEK